MGEIGNNCGEDVRRSFIDTYIWVGPGKMTPQGNMNKIQTSQVHSYSVPSNVRNRNYVAAIIRKLRMLTSKKYIP